MPRPLFLSGPSRSSNVLGGRGKPEVLHVDSLRMRRFYVLSAAGLIALVGLALAGAYALRWLPTEPGLPPLPRVDPSSFAPGVREQVEEALAAARADNSWPAFFVACQGTS